MIVSLGVPGPAMQQARWNWRRGSIFASYTLAKQRSNGNGAFAVPFSGSPEGEWGPANNDMRHRLNASFNTQALKNMNMSLSFNYNTANPYTIRTGIDDNLDLIFNDRPVGVTRNTERGDAIMNMSANASYTVSFGRKPAAGAPVGGGEGTTVIRVGEMVMMRGGAPGGAGAARYRVNFNIGVQNLTNRVNHTGWNGTMSSPFFGQSTSVGSPRKINLGVSFSF